MCSDSVVNFPSADVPAQSTAFGTMKGVGGGAGGRKGALEWHHIPLPRHLAFWARMQVCNSLRGIMEIKTNLHPGICTPQTR